MDSLARVVCAGVVLSGREPRPVSLGLWRAGAFADDAAVRRRRRRGLYMGELGLTAGLTRVVRRVFAATLVGVPTFQ